uniref:Uncharacterized protein n=1 Tax=Amphimedon queenslandica TaxID=400682 RepID=A0A1X7T8T6_AMPQE
MILNTRRDGSDIFYHLKLILKQCVCFFSS